LLRKKERGRAKKNGLKKVKAPTAEEKHPNSRFPPYAAPHWKSGSRVYIHLTGGKSKGLE
jgi:hypothetical protein